MYLMAVAKAIMRNHPNMDMAGSKVSTNIGHSVTRARYSLHKRLFRRAVTLHKSHLGPRAVSRSNQISAAVNMPTKAMALMLASLINKPHIISLASKDFVSHVSVGRYRWALRRALLVIC